MFFNLRKNSDKISHFKMRLDGLSVDTLDVNAINEKYQSFFQKEKMSKDYKISVLDKYCQALKEPHASVETSVHEHT